MIRTFPWFFLLGTFLVAVPSSAAEPPAGGPTAEETRAFMKSLAKYVFDHHLKQDRNSPQAGMIYEYYDTTKAGKHGQWVQGEALDTMHDGAWFVSALAQAYRATGDPAYLEFLERWTLPFYLKMLNHSDELFSPERDDSCGKIKFGREHMLQRGEKGFVPYWWDDGASVSLEGKMRVGGKAAYPCRDDLAGRPNPDACLSGYSLGCSNHLAQDLALMLLAVWPLADGPKAPLVRFRGEIIDAIRNLHASRMKHHGHIPMLDAALGRIADAEALKQVPEMKTFTPKNEYVRAHDFQPGQRLTLPGFTDNQEYLYWSTLARNRGEFPRAAARALIYDAFTLPQLYRAWSDTASVPPGINRFDLAAIFLRDGKMEKYRSDRDVGSGSRFGPQNMIGCGRALQMLTAYPGLWEQPKAAADELLVRFIDGPLTIDGVPKADYGKPVTLGNVQVGLVATPAALYLAGEFTGAGAELVVAHKQFPERKATLKLKKDGTIAATGSGGAALRCTHRLLPADRAVRFEIRLPFMIDKEQGSWWTGIEQGRYRIAVGEKSRDFVLLSGEQRVRDALEAELAGGLRSWQRIFKEKGYVPTGTNANPVGTMRSEILSDTGGYAHLIAAGAQYLLYLEGKRDWKQDLSR